MSGAYFSAVNRATKDGREIEAFEGIVGGTGTSQETVEDSCMFCAEDRSKKGLTNSPNCHSALQRDRDMAHQYLIRN